MAPTPPPRPPQQQQAQAQPQSSLVFDPTQLPSIRKDGLTVAEEYQHRRRTCRFLEEAARRLKLPRVALATAVVIFHRFFAKHAFSAHDRFEVAVACIVLAAKVEECPQRVRAVVEQCHALKLGGLQKAGVAVAAGASLSEDDFNKLKERVLLLERILLHTIGFELSIDHPFKFLAEQVTLLVKQQKLAFVPGSTLEFLPEKPTVESLEPAQTRDALMKGMMQGSMSFANDSLHTTLCLQYDPKDIATTCVYLAGQFYKVQTVQDKSWMALITKSGMAPTTLAAIAVEILDLIASKQRPEQVAAIAAVRKQLPTLKKKPPAAASSSASSGEQQSPPAKRPRTT